MRSSKLVRVAKQRFGLRHVTLRGRHDVQRRLRNMAAELGLEIDEERQR
jgi:hypothetical protein